MEIEGRCPRCRERDIRATRVPDEEDTGAPWPLLSMDPLERSPRLALRSGHLRRRSDMLLRRAKDFRVAAPLR
jgi:hypothetical protein